LNDEQREAKFREQISSGIEATDFLNNKQYVSSVKAMKKELFAEFTKTKYQQSNERDEIWRKMQSLDWVHNRMERIARDGRQAQSMLTRLINAITGKEND